MGVGENLLCALTIVSASVSLYLVTTEKDNDRLVRTVGTMSIFYGLWAVKNLLTTKPYEKGHYAFFTCAAGCYGLRKVEAAKYLAVLGAVGVLAAFVIAGKRVLLWPASKTAYVSKKPLYWAYVMQVYFAQSLLLWGLVSYKLVCALL